MYKISYSSGSASGNGMRTVSIFRFFRLFRLFRIARVERLLSAVPELAIMVKGMRAAMRSMAVIMSMLSIIIYVVAVIFVELLSGTKTGAGRFDNVPQAMNFMFVQVLCGFDATLVGELLVAGWIPYILWLFYILFGALLIMNMLIGLVCDVVSATAEAESEVSMLANMEYEIGLLDVDGSGTISKEEYTQTLGSPSMISRLDELGVDVGALLGYLKFVYEGYEELSISDFVEMVVQFRGAKPATVKDIVDLRKIVSTSVASLEALVLEQGARARF